MSSLRDRLIIKIARLKDFLAHVDRADRVYYVERGTYLVALASNFLWEGDISKEDKKIVEKWNKIKEYKGVEVEEFLDAYEASDYLKAISSKS
jgi:hypothetical protein